jgi:transcriptional antiterminator RfaH
MSQASEMEADGSSAAGVSVSVTPMERLQLGQGERWYVAVTQPLKERYAAENLVNQGYRHFLPLQLSTSRHARRFRTRLAPVFPRYLFVILDPHRGRWRCINGTFGVQHLIAEGDAPLAVRPGVVETLVASSDPRGVLVFRPSSLTPGDRVRLVSGPFAGALGVLHGLEASGRVRVLLELMGAPTPVRVDAKAIAVA